MAPVGNAGAAVVGRLKRDVAAAAKRRQPSSQDTQFIETYVL